MRSCSAASPIPADRHSQTGTKTTDTYFGTSFYTLDTSGERPLITDKKVVLKNDYIHHVIDIYHI